MEDGRISAFGTFDSVAKNSSLFAHIKRHRAEKEEGKGSDLALLKWVFAMAHA